MSDTTTMNSIWNNLKNKVTYRVYNATLDPDANKFVAKQSEKQQNEQNINQNNTDKTTDNNDGDSNKFSIKRVVKKVGNQTLNIIQKTIVPFISLMLAMIIANELIVYSAPIRILFFIFTFLICFFIPPFMIILTIFYIFKGGYSYFVNNMTERPKKEIMPTIYSLLPVTTYKPESSLGAILLYPFTYPKTENNALQLPKTMNQYWLDLQDSFPGLNKIQNLPIFSNEINKIKKELSELYNINTINNKINNENIKKENTKMK